MNWSLVNYDLALFSVILTGYTVRFFVAVVLGAIEGFNEAAK